MESDEPKEAQEANPEKPDKAEPAARQKTGEENAQPIVLPVVVVSDDQVESGETPAARAPEGQAGDRRQPAGTDEAPNRPDVVALSTEVRELLDRLRPSREAGFPKLIQENDPADDDEITFEEAVDHFVSLAQDRMRELNLGEEDSVSRGLAGHGGATAGDIVRGPHRPGDNQTGSGASLLSAPAAGGSGDFTGAAGPGPAMAAAEPRSADGSFTMPRLQLVVELAHGRAMYDEAIDEAGQRLAPSYRAIASEEIDLAFWHYNRHRRAANPSLRGPG